MTTESAVRALMPPEFSLCGGGPVYRLARAMRAGVLRGLPGLGIAMALATWGPLLILSAAQRLALPGGTHEPFLADIGVHSRFLVAIPLFFAAEVWIDPQLRNLVRHLVDARLVPSTEVPALQAAVRSVSRLRDSVVPEALLVGLVIASAVAGVRVDLPAGISTWQAIATEAGPRLTLAGWWYAGVALPIFQFVALRWAWRIVLWVGFLWRLARLDLRLIPAHPDLSGGLGPLGTAQSNFCILSVIGSIVVAGTLGEQMLFAGATINTLKLPVLGIVVANLIWVLGPLFLFLPRLFLARRQGLREYSHLAVDYTRSFDAKWIRAQPQPDDSLLGTPDIQSLADLANSFAVVERMRLVPFGRRLAWTVLAATLAPMLPLLLLEFPLEEIVLKALKLMFGA